MSNKRINHKKSKEPSKKINIKNSNRKLTVNLSTELFAISILPILSIGIIIMVLTWNTFTNNTKEQIKLDLYNASVALMATFDQNVGDYFYADEGNGDLWKGGYNLAKSNNLLENINEKTGIDITILAKDRIVITTAVDKKSGDMLDINIDNAIMSDIFKNAKKTFDDGMYISKKQQYMYATPIMQTDDSEVVAMLVLSYNKNSSMKETNNILGIIAIVLVIIIVAMSILIIRFTQGITKALKASSVALEKVSSGKLRDNKELDKVRRKDEIGLMSRSVSDLSIKLREIIQSNLDMTKEIEETATELDTTARGTKESINIVDNAMDTMAQTAKKQADIVTDVNEDMNVLGAMIEDTYVEIKSISDYNTDMLKSSKVAGRIVSELTYIKEGLNNVIDVINKQTSDTYNLTKDIKKYAEMITSFADETNLLALNASIEAARVGEAGKGFAIVANQIQILADQSNVVSNDITKTVNLLVSDSKKSLNTMGQVNNIIEKLNTNIDDTKEIFSVVNEGIDYSLEGLKKIENQAAKMDNSRSSIMEVIQDLDTVAKQNIKCAADTEEVTKHIGQLFDEIENIKLVTEKLVDNMKVFEV